MKETILLAIAVILAGAMIAVSVNVGKVPNLGQAPSGNSATVASSTSLAISANSAAVAFATSTCTSRVIGTQNTGILVTFDDRFTPTLGTGHWQGPSTTVAYDSGLFGCGQWRIISASGGVITVTDVR